MRSVSKGLERCGAEAKVTDDPRELEAADGLVLPGVGAFKEARRRLEALRGSLVGAAGSGRPLLGICLGLQLLFTRSFEGGVSKGLNLIEGDVVKLPKGVKIPHIGWNTINIVRENEILDGVEDGSFMYFAHSYVSRPKEAGAVVSLTEYGAVFPSVVAKGNIYATQFHPEKSGAKGLRILKNFVDAVKR